MVFVDSWKYNKEIGPILEEMKLFTLPNNLSDIFTTIQIQRRYFIDVSCFIMF